MASHDPLYKIKVTNIVDPENFWAQIVGEESFREFTHKEEELNTYCQQRGVTEFRIEELLIDQLILVRSDCWDKWVRAKVVLTAEDTQEVDVSHIDYGKTEYTDSSQIIIDVPEQYNEVNWPISCYRSKLRGVCPIARTYTRRATEDFSEMAWGRALDGQVVEIDDCVCVLDIFIEEGLHVQSVSEILIEEGHAKPLSASVKPEDAQPEVQGFDMNKLLQPRQLSNNTDEAEEEEEEDIERSLFCRQISGDFIWTPSDKTLGVGKNYQPNWPQPVGHAPAPQLPEITYDQQVGGLDIQEETDDMYKVYAKGTTVYQEPVAEVSMPSHSMQSTQHSQMVPKPQHPAKDKIGIKRDSSNSPGRLGRGRGSPAPASRRRETPPGSRDISPCPPSDPESAVKKIIAEPVVPKSESQERTRMPAVEKVKATSQTESDTSSQDSTADRGKKKKSKKLPEINAEKLKNEYEWQKHKLTHKLKKIFGRLPSSTLEKELIEITMLLYPVRSLFEGLPGPKELYLCIEVALTLAVENPKLKDNVVQLLETLSSDENFPSAVSELLMKLQADYVRIGQSVHVRQCALNYCQLLASLYISSVGWIQPARDALGTCLYNTMEKWAVFNKKRNHPEPADLMELYSMCMFTVLSSAGAVVEEHQPQLLSMLYAEITHNLLSNDLDRSLKLQMLALYVLRQNKWLTLDEQMENKKTPAAAVEVCTCDASTDTHELRPAHFHRGVQTDLKQESSSGRLSRQNSPEDGNPYCGVQQMLNRLNMQELEGFFMKNAIRDTTLAMDFADVKELLRECGFLPGQIYEIRAYILQHPFCSSLAVQSNIYRPPHSRMAESGRPPPVGERGRSAVSSSRSSPTSSVRGFHDAYECQDQQPSNYDWQHGSATIHRGSDAREYWENHGAGNRDLSTQRSRDCDVQSTCSAQESSHHEDLYGAQRNNNMHHAQRSPTQLSNHQRHHEANSAPQSYSSERYRNDSNSSQNDYPHERSYSRSTSREERAKYVEYVDAFEEQVNEDVCEEVQKIMPQNDARNTDRGMSSPVAHSKSSQHSRIHVTSSVGSLEEPKSYSENGEHQTHSSAHDTMNHQPPPNYVCDSESSFTRSESGGQLNGSQRSKRSYSEEDLQSRFKQPLNHSSQSTTPKGAVLKTKGSMEVRTSLPSRSDADRQNSIRDDISSSADSEMEISPKRPAVKEYVDAFEDETLPGQTVDEASHNNSHAAGQKRVQKERHKQTHHGTHEKPPSLLDYMEGTSNRQSKYRSGETSDSYEYPETSDEESTPRPKFNIKIREHKKPAFDPEKAFGGAAKCTVCGSTAHLTLQCPKKVSGYIIG